MKSYTIANPPCGIYKGDLPLGYAYYQTLLDIHSRFTRDFNGMEVVCHKYSLNALGKRAENLDLDGTIMGLDNYVRRWIKRGTLRDRMNFSFSGDLLDTSPESIRQAKTVFRELYKKGYLLRKGEAFYLDAKKIGKDFDLKGIVQKINFFSERSKKEFLRVIERLDDPIRITKKRAYSAPNPFGGEEVAPIFVISNLWEAYFDQEIDLVAVSEKELTRYLMLRFLSQVPISSRLPMRNIFVYNYIEPEGGFESWDMEELTKDGAGSDSLRYAFAKSCSLSEQKTELKKGLLEGGRKLVYLTGNLKKLFLKEELRFKGFPSAEDEAYIKGMESFKYSLVLGNLEMKLRQVSRDVNISRDKGTFSSKRAGLFDKYLTLVKELSPFCPFICEKVVREL
jgi:hypothetical protein